MRIPRPALQWSEALRMVGDGVSLYSDFTLIRVARDGDRVEFTRTSVGKHLLLGGDNLDLTLAWLVESKLGRQLSLRQKSGLRRSCASATPPRGILRRRPDGRGIRETSDGW